MNTLNLLTWAAGYIVVATMIFNLLRYGFGANLASTIILSATLSFLIFRIESNQGLSYWFSENIWLLIVCGTVIGSIIAIARSGKAGSSEVDTKPQQ